MTAQPGVPRHETIIILDFGSQYTQLIARRVRELGVYAEILPYHASWEEISRRNLRGIILSGGPQSVFADHSPHPCLEVYDFPGPILGICYGMMLLAQQLGGQVCPTSHREFGRAEFIPDPGSRLLASIPTGTVWMSHGDRIEVVPPGFTEVGQTASAIAAMSSDDQRIHGIQFHPEVVHTEHGMTVFRNFLFEICGCEGDWTVHSFVQEAVESIERSVGEDSALCALSGGVDSTVAAVLVQRAIGNRLSCVFVDNGLLRKNEFQEVLGMFRDHLELNVTGVDARRQFLDPLHGVLDPEEKRKIIGTQFIRVFESQACQLGDPPFLVQGTLYPDVIESISVKGPADVIKSHHNVGGLPEDLKFKLVEPLRELFKDEVRRAGGELGIPSRFLERQPFPGPGLAVRIVGEVTEERLGVLREADAIVDQEIRKAGLYQQVWQAFAVLLPIRSVGVMGDNRTYEHVAAIRAVYSQDGMTADWVPLPHDLLALVSNRIVNEVRGINRVVYDISSKPPSTIEWE